MYEQEVKKLKEVIAILESANQNKNNYDDKEFIFKLIDKTNLGTGVTKSQITRKTQWLTKTERDSILLKLKLENKIQSIDLPEFKNKTGKSPIVYISV